MCARVLVARIGIALTIIFWQWRGFFLAAVLYLPSLSFTCLLNSHSTELFFVCAYFVQFNRLASFFFYHLFGTSLSFSFLTPWCAIQTPFFLFCYAVCSNDSSNLFWSMIIVYTRLIVTAPKKISRNHQLIGFDAFFYYSSLHHGFKLMYPFVYWKTVTIDNI